MKSYYDTMDPPDGMVYAHLITNNPKRDLALATKREQVERDNQIILDLRTSKAFESPYSSAPNGRIAFPEVRSRLKHNNDRQRQLYKERLQRENALYFKRIGRQKHHVMNDKHDHDWHLSRTVMYPVLLGTAQPRARGIADAATHPPAHGHGSDAKAVEEQQGAAAPAVAPTPPQTAPPAQRGLVPPRRRMTAVG